MNNEQMSVILGIVAMTPKGEYSSEAYYEKLNTVLYNDSTYMAIKPSTGVLPTNTEYWQLIGGGVTREYVASQVVDNLDSNETTKSLSANQGNKLNKSKATIYDTVADMKADASLKDGMVAQTLGYYEANDGGAATYEIITGDLTDDGSSIIEITNGLYAKLVVKSDIINNLSLNRIFRRFETENNSSMSTYDENINGASGLQGGCKTGDNTCILAYWNGIDVNKNENKIIELDISTGQVLKSIECNYGWCNGITYDYDKELVYVFPRGRFENNVQTNLKQMIILNYNDLSYVDTITFNTNNYIMDGSYENSELWLMGENCSAFYKINTSDYSISKTILTNIPSSNNNFYYQNFCMYNNKFYVIGSTPAALYVYDMFGNLCKQYDLPQYMNGLYQPGEYQFIYPVGNFKFYIGSQITNITQISILDLLNNAINGEKNSVPINNTNGLITLYVDSSNNNLNPNGLESNPFKEISEATFISNRNAPVIVYIKNGSYAHVNMYNCNNYRFTAENTNNANVIIKGLKVRYSLNTVFSYLTINNSEFLNDGGSLSAQQSIITIDHCNINSNEKYGIYDAQSSTVVLGNENIITTSTKANIYVASGCILNNSANNTFTIQKASINSKVLYSKMPLFQNEQALYYGVLNYDSVFASFFDKTMYKNIYVEYLYKQVKKIVHFNANLSQVCITDNYIDGTGNSYFVKCYVSIGNDKINITGNSNVKIENNNGTAIITKNALSNNESGSLDYIQVLNIYVD